MHSFFILYKKTHQNPKTNVYFLCFFILYKLFDDCQAENNGAFSDSCYFCNVPVCRTCRAAGEIQGCLCPRTA